MLRSREAFIIVAVLAVSVLVGVAVTETGGSGRPAGGTGAHSPGQSRNSPGAGVPAAPVAQGSGPALCGSQRTAVDGGAYTVQNNEWGSGAPECVTTTGTGGFTVTRSAIANSASGAPGGYPSIYRGCHWGACTPGSGLPVPVSRLLAPGTVTTSWVTAQPGAGAYDVAYDIWFNQALSTSGQPDGAELMIWLNHNGPVQPFGSQVATASLGGRSYNVWYGKQAWNTISYSMTDGTTSVRDLDIGQFAADAVSRGYLRKSWYLIGVEAGFELWQGGAGLATESFTVNAPGAGSVPVAAGPTAAAPSSPPAAAAVVSCTVRYSVAHSWPGGFQAQAVLTNTGASPVSGWTLAWTFTAGERVTNLWNGQFTQSGGRVNVANASYNATISPSGSVTIGFVGGGTPGSSPPTAFQLNGTHCET